MAESSTVVTSMAASSPIPFKAVEASESSALGGSWLATVLLLAIAVAGVMLLRRRLGGPARHPSGRRQVTVVESTRLGERMRLSVVHYRDRELLIAHGDQAATVLADEQRTPAQGATQ